MIIHTVNGKSTVLNFDTRLEELEYFSKKCYEFNADRPDYIKSYAEIKHDVALLRTFNTKTQREDTEIVTMVSDCKYVGLNWKHVNKMVENSQNAGTNTHINGWFLA